MTDSELPPTSIPIVPPPWNCKCTAYLIPFFTSASQPLPQSKILAPLEAASETWTSEKFAGKHKGGLGMAQIIRYSETPVGAYDELCILPGHFGVPEEGLVKQGEKKEKVGEKKEKVWGKFLRITGIWVSQRETCMNGRVLWNIPKHIAQFKFTQTTPTAPFPLRVEISDPNSSTPFFATTIQRPVAYTPSFPMNSDWNRYLGQPTKLLQPPLPVGNPPEIEVGSQDWMLIAPTLRGRAKLMWFNMEQPGKEGVRASDGDADGKAKGAGAQDNWWPGIGRWRVGIELKEAVLTLGDPEVLKREGRK